MLEAVDADADAAAVPVDALPVCVVPEEVATLTPPVALPDEPDALDAPAVELDVELAAPPVAVFWRSSVACQIERIRIDNIQGTRQMSSRRSD